MKTKITIIELLRIFFCLFIVMHHITVTSPFHMPLGCVAVEFFFMIMGYFAYKTIMEKRQEINEPMKFASHYTISKLLPIAPFAIAGTLLCTIVSIRRGVYIDWLNLLTYDMTEFLQIQLPLIAAQDPYLMFTYGNPPLWFLSATLVTLPIVIYIAIRYHDVFSHYLTWILPIALFALMIQRFRSPFPWSDCIYFIPSGIIRALSTLIMGCSLYYVTNFIKGKYQAFTHKKFIDTLSIILFIATLAFIALTSYGKIPCCSVLFVGSIYLLLIIAFSGIGIFQHQSNGIITKLGNLTMPVYCLHYPVLKLITSLKGNNSTTTNILLIIIFCVLIALAFYCHHRYKQFKHAQEASKQL